MKRKHQEKQVGASARFKLLAIYLMWLESSRWITVYRRVKQEMEKSISAKTSAKHILFFETIMTSIRVWTLKEWKRTSITILSKFAFRIEYQLNHPNGIDDKWQWTGMKSTSNICSTLVRTIYQRCPFAQSLKSQIPPPSAESKDVNLDLFQPIWSHSFLTLPKYIGPPTMVAAEANFKDRFH